MATGSDSGRAAPAPVVVPVRGIRGVAPRAAAAFGLQGAGRVLRDFWTYLPTQVIPAVTGFLVLPILARKLAPTEIGTLAITQTVITFGWIVIGQWLTTSAIREFPAFRKRGELKGFNSALRRGIGVSLLLFGAFVGLLALASIQSQAIGDNLWAIAAATFGLTCQNLATTLFTANLRARAFAIVEVLGRTGGIALGTWLVFENRGVHGYLVGLAVASCVVGIVGLLASWPRAKGGAATPVELRGWIFYGLPIAVSAFAALGYQFVDRYLLALLENTGATGLYSLGAILGDKPVAIIGYAFYISCRPLLVHAFERSGRVEVERILHEYTRIMLLLLVPVVAFLVAAARPLMIMLTGKETGHLYYLPAVPLVRIVAFAALLNALSLLAATGLILSRDSRPMIYAAFVGLGTNVVANLALIPPFGVTGAAVAAPIGASAMLAAILVWSERRLTWHFPFATLARSGVAAAVGCVAAWLALELHASDAGKTALAAAVGLPVYAVVLYLLGERPSLPRRVHEAAA